MSSATPVTLVGATGLTGAATLRALLASSHPCAISALTRRPISETPSNPSSSFSNETFSDLAEAVKGTVATKGGLYVSCLGTTREAAGGIENQIKIDLDLNRDLAKKAKDDGASTMILVSAAGSSSSSMFAYPKMKGELEDAVKGMGFEHCVILQPGMLLGPVREGHHTTTEAIAQQLFRSLRRVGVPVNSLAVDGTDVGQCIAHLAAHPPNERVTVLSNSQIVGLAKKWREENPSGPA